MSWFWHPYTHYIFTLIHIMAGLFWLGWMVFMFLILAPKLLKIAPEKSHQLQAAVQQRIRKVVFWLILIILSTGLYNMSYRGLLDTSMLLETTIGQRMLIKLGAALVIFSIYFAAPSIIKMAQKNAENSSADSCHGHPDPTVKKVTVILHLLAFSAGVVAAYLGITIGG